MNLLSLGHLALSGGQGKGRHMPTDNSTIPALPPNLLEAVIPGYSAISGFVLDVFGFDISVVVTLVGVCFGLSKAYSWLWLNFLGFFERYCMSRVIVDNRDDLFDIIIRWMSAQTSSKTARGLIARSKTGSAVEEDEDERETATAALDDNGQFNWGKWQGRIPPRYEPSHGSYRFWHGGSYFVLARSRKELSGIRFSDDDEEETIELRCVGWRTEPVKRLIQEIKIWSISMKDDMTGTRHADSKQRGGMRWSTTHLRPSRPISTVILDDDQKERIVKDMNSFLHPASPKWYATRGIPYRRGYLFYGPPGTGKTSLSFALAGIFGLTLYCFSLNDPDMTEGDLRQLFNDLPRRCIVLLEDVDSAGVKRPDHADVKKNASRSQSRVSALASESSLSRQDSGIDAADKPLNGRVRDTEKVGSDGRMHDKSRSQQNGSNDAKGAAKPAETSWTLDDLARAFMKAMNQRPRPNANDDSDDEGTGRNQSRRKGNVQDEFSNKKSRNNKDAGISLSGLLNALDGVSSHEGRVLIMTTNHIEALDEALIRTGRVDMRINFDYASTSQIKALFLRMYAVDVEEGPSRLEDLDLFSDGKQVSRDEAVDALTRTAEDFARCVPNKRFSPSDVQGYLLLHKETPGLAYKNVGRWVEEELKKKDDAEKGQSRKA